MPWPKILLVVSVNHVLHERMARLIALTAHAFEKGTTMYDFCRLLASHLFQTLACFNALECYSGSDVGVADGCDLQRTGWGSWGGGRNHRHHRYIMLVDIFGSSVGRC